MMFLFPLALMIYLTITVKSWLLFAVFLICWFIDLILWIRREDRKKETEE